MTYILTKNNFPCMRCINYDQTRFSKTHINDAINDNASFQSQSRILQSHKGKLIGSGFTHGMYACQDNETLQWRFIIFALNGVCLASFDEWDRKETAMYELIKFMSNKSYKIQNVQQLGEY